MAYQIYLFIILKISQKHLKSKKKKKNLSNLGVKPLIFNFRSRSVKRLPAAPFLYPTLLKPSSPETPPPHTRILARKRRTENLFLLSLFRNCIEESLWEMAYQGGNLKSTSINGVKMYTVTGQNRSLATWLDPKKLRALRKDKG